MSDFKDVGNLGDISQLTFELILVIVLMLFVVLLLYCLIRKYRNQYASLQEQFKFKRLRNENDQKDSDVGDPEHGAEAIDESKD